MSLARDDAAALLTAKALGSASLAKHFRMQNPSEAETTNMQKSVLKLQKQLYEICFQNHALTKLSTFVPHSATRVGYQSSKGIMTKKYVDKITKALECLNSLLHALYEA